jgi:hypothetical protein
MTLTELWVDYEIAIIAGDALTTARILLEIQKETQKLIMKEARERAKKVGTYGG